MKVERVEVKVENGITFLNGVRITSRSGKLWNYGKVFHPFGRDGTPYGYRLFSVTDSGVYDFNPHLERTKGIVVAVKGHFVKNADIMPMGRCDICGKSFEVEHSFYSDRLTRKLENAVAEKPVIFADEAGFHRICKECFRKEILKELKKNKKGGESDGKGEKTISHPSKNG